MNPPILHFTFEDRAAGGEQKVSARVAFGRKSWPVASWLGGRMNKPTGTAGKTYITLFGPESPLKCGETRQQSNGRAAWDFHLPRSRQAQRKSLDGNRLVGTHRPNGSCQRAYHAPFESFDAR